MARKIAPTLTEYLDLRFDLITEAQKEQMRREAKALLAVARAARIHGTLPTNEQYDRLTRALARLDRLTKGGGKP